MKRREERKKAQLVKIRKSKKVQWKELGQDIQKLPRAWDPRDVQHSKDEIETVQKGAPRNTKNEGHIRPSQSPSDVERKQKAYRIIIHEQRAGT